ncbi:MAG TPA: hypothetical protein VFI20_12430 [Terracidiphilus sp.]|nr:hypothetical protein [Terracidiphilus sp.]
MRRLCRIWECLAIAAVVLCPSIYGQRQSDLITQTPLPRGSVLVIGFLGGYERWNDEHRSVRRLVLKLRQRPGIYTESIENHRRKVALRLLRRALDRNGDGKLDAEERSQARVILFGQSWGGAAAISTARDLGEMGVPVLLTVQVDSVGLRDQWIPPNVRAAVNFYQHDPLTIQGRSEIRAQDPTQTRILGNFEESYVARPVDESNASWPRRVLGGSHVKMELDPAVWRQVESYITNVAAGRLP